MLKYKALIILQCIYMVSSSYTTTCYDKDMNEQRCLTDKVKEDYKEEQSKCGTDETDKSKFFTVGEAKDDFVPCRDQKGPCG